MTKKELVEALAHVPDDTVVEIAVRASLRTLDLRVVGSVEKILYNPASAQLQLHRVGNKKSYHKQNVGRVLIRGEFIES